MTPTRGRARIVAALALFGFALFYLVSALPLGLGTRATPGPGLVPVAIGSVLLLCTIAHLVAILTRSRSGPAGVRGSRSPGTTGPATRAMAQTGPAAASGASPGAAAQGGPAAASGASPGVQAGPAPARGDATDAAAPGGRDRYAVAGILACTIVYPLILDSLKFLVATAGTAAVMLVLLSPRHPSRGHGLRRMLASLVLAAGMAVSAFVLFARLLGVALPSGPLEYLLFRAGQ